MLVTIIGVTVNLVFTHREKEMFVIFYVFLAYILRVSRKCNMNEIMRFF